MFINFGCTAYKMRGDDIRKVLNTIKPGDVLLRRYDHYISGLMIPGYFTHAAIYVGDDTIIHMIGDGICEEDILMFCRCDEIAIIHCNDEQLSKTAVDKAKSYLEQQIEYDFNFDFSDSAQLSCTELVNDVYNGPTITKMKRSYIMPDDFLTLDRSLFEISYRK